MIAWFAMKTLGLARWAWILILVAAVALVVGIAIRSEKADDKANQEIGASGEREKSNSVVIGNVEKANEAREEIRSPGTAGDCARYAVCVRSARNPAQCQRFLPPVQEGHSFGCPGPVER